MCINIYNIYNIQHALNMVNTRFTTIKLIQTKFQYNIIYNIYICIGFFIIVP
jgi:hypothetical protein